MRNSEIIVWLTEERTFAVVVGGIQAYHTVVRYRKGGIEYEVMVESDEFTIFEDGRDLDDE